MASFGCVDEEDPETLEKLLKDIEFENQHLVRAIECEDQTIEALDAEIKWKSSEIKRLKAETTKMDEDAKMLHKQFTHNRSTCENLKKMNQVLVDHESDLQKKLETTILYGQQERAELSKTLRHYQEIWDDYEAEYKKFPLAIKLAEEIAKCGGIECQKKELEEKRDKLKKEIRELKGESIVNEDGEVDANSLLNKNLDKVRSEIEEDSGKSVTEGEELDRDRQQRDQANQEEATDTLQELADHTSDMQITESSHRSGSRDEMQETDCRSEVTPDSHETSPSRHEAQVEHMQTDDTLIHQKEQAADRSVREMQMETCSDGDIELRQASCDGELTGQFNPHISRRNGQDQVPNQTIDQVENRALWHSEQQVIGMDEQQQPAMGQAEQASIGDLQQQHVREGLDQQLMEGSQQQTVMDQSQQQRLTEVSRQQNVFDQSHQQKLMEVSQQQPVVNQSHQQRLVEVSQQQHVLDQSYQQKLMEVSQQLNVDQSHQQRLVEVSQQQCVMDQSHHEFEREARQTQGAMDQSEQRYPRLQKERQHIVHRLNQQVQQQIDHRISVAAQQQQQQITHTQTSGQNTKQVLHIPNVSTQPFTPPMVQTAPSLKPVALPQVHSSLPRLTVPKPPGPVFCVPQLSSSVRGGSMVPSRSTNQQQQPFMISRTQPESTRAQPESTKTQPEPTMQSRTQSQPAQSRGAQGTGQSQTSVQLQTFTIPTSPCLSLPQIQQSRPSSAPPQINVSINRPVRPVAKPSIPIQKTAVPSIQQPAQLSRSTSRSPALGIRQQATSKPGPQSVEVGIQLQKPPVRSSAPPRPAPQSSPLRPQASPTQPSQKRVSPPKSHTYRQSMPTTPQLTQLQMPTGLTNRDQHGTAQHKSESQTKTPPQAYSEPSSQKKRSRTPENRSTPQDDSYSALSPFSKEMALQKERLNDLKSKSPGWTYSGRPVSTGHSTTSTVAEPDTAASVASPGSFMQPFSFGQDKSPELGSEAPMNFFGGGGGKENNTLDNLFAGGDVSSPKNMFGGMASPEGAGQSGRGFFNFGGSGGEDSSEDTSLASLFGAGDADQGDSTFSFSFGGGNTDSPKFGFF